MRSVFIVRRDNGIVLSSSAESAMAMRFEEVESFACSPPPAPEAINRDADLAYLQEDIGDLVNESLDGLKRVRDIV